MTSVSRNQPCPCGSGKKYKKCCMTTDLPGEAADRVQGLRAQAYKSMSQEDWLDAIEIFKRILDDVTDPYNVLEAIAGCYDGLENYLAASEFYEKALAICPEHRRSDLLYQLGVSRCCAERIDKARDAFTECMATLDDPEESKYISRLLETLDEIQDGRKKSNIFLIQSQMQRAFTEMEGDLYDRASARLERLIQIAPENPAIFYNLGIAYTFLKQEDEAMQVFSRSVELYPGYYQAWYNMGQIALISKRDFSLAVHCFDRATLISPEYMAAHFQKGIAFEYQGDPANAAKCWERVLELDPKNAEAQEKLDKIRKTQ